ncbi:MAG: hypothetical protein K2Y37_04955 [Pirellulales bacterium]|nr:hypothetical protein [Pirellulales bacterium]
MTVPPSQPAEPPAPAAVVEAIHASGRRFVMVITGGGSGAIRELLVVPGGSRVLLEAIIPYAPEALTRWLGADPEQFCSPATARAMAMRAFERAVSYRATRPAVAGSGHAGIAAAAAIELGFGCTASLATDRPKRGPHRVHLAWQTASATAAYSLELVKGARARDEEETLVSRLVLNALAEAVNVPQRVSLPLRSGEEISRSIVHAPDSWQQLFCGARTSVYHGPTRTASATPRAVFPGAFNPRHHGHRRMQAIAAARLGVPVEHEIAIVSVDKAPLDFLDLESRAGQFSADEALWFTRAATFVEKSRLFPNATFVVGADTVTRIGDPRYYGNYVARRDEALTAIAAAGCRFLVFGRKVGQSFATLDDLDLPPALAAMCVGVPAEEFRDDISSTELRHAAVG